MKGAGGSASDHYLVRQRPDEVTWHADVQQDRVVCSAPGSGPWVVWGAPGSGRTATLVRAVEYRVHHQGTDPKRVLVVGSSRQSSDRLRDRLSAPLSRTGHEPLARSPHSFAFALLGRYATLTGQPPPRLLSGPEQDTILEDLLVGHEHGSAPAIAWPRFLQPALSTKGFRAQLRSVLIAAMEHGVDPTRLATMGHEQGRQEWVAAAQFFQEYVDVLALAGPGLVDPASVLGAATRTLLADDRFLQQERERWDFVAIDDAHDVGPASLELLSLLIGGRDCVVTADPDCATQTFRGASPTVLHRWSADLLASGCAGSAATDQEVFLNRRWRHGPALSSICTRIAQNIGVQGVSRHRQALSATIDDDVQVTVLPSEGHEVAAVVNYLLGHHQKGVPWAQMAVIVRSQSNTQTLRRALVRAGIPISSNMANLPLHQQPAVSPLLSMLSAVLTIGEKPSQSTVLEWVAGPYGGADPLTLTRLQTAARTLGATALTDSQAEDLLLMAIGDVDLLHSLPSHICGPLERVQRMWRAAIDELIDPEARASEILWAMWDAAEARKTWVDQSAATGSQADRAHQALDAVLALFDALGRLEEKDPDLAAGQVLQMLIDQDIPADTLARVGQRAQVPVTIATAQAAAGREWDVVAIPMMQEGRWPNTRLRDTLLGASDLGTYLEPRSTRVSVRERYQAVLADERRMLLVAASRARTHLLVTAIRNAEQAPSSFLDDIDPHWSEKHQAPGVTSAVADETQLTLYQWVAIARQTLMAAHGAQILGRDVDDDLKHEAAAVLAMAAESGISGAAPHHWWGWAQVSTQAPVVAEGQVPVLSPSTVEALATCPRRWFLDRHGGTTPESALQKIGTLVHEICARYPAGPVAALLAALDESWSTLELPDTWETTVLRERAQRMLNHFAWYVTSSTSTLVDVERDFSVQIDEVAIRGRVDRLERHDDGHLVVVDLKTGKSAPTEREVATHPQLGTYQIAVESGGFPEPDAEDSAQHRSGGAVLVQLGSTAAKPRIQSQAPLGRSHDPDWARTMLVQAGHDAKGPAFRAVVGKQCSQCQHRLHCPAQSLSQGASE